MEGIVKTFLEENEVKSGWQKLILQSNDLTQKLGEIIQTLPFLCYYTPQKEKLLNAFSHAEPGDIKVVIIGTSPAPDKSIANGLAFSSDGYEQKFFHLAAIPKVHNALRVANILQRDKKDYHCGHQQWAEKGVLLLNAALTITEGDGDAKDIEKHCNIWREFLQDMLCEWINETDINDKLFVMRWGYPIAKKPGKVNYAESVWSKAHELVKDKLNVHTFKLIHHPTYPRAKEDNNFSSEAPKHVKEINTHYNNIFHIPVTPDDSDFLTSLLSKLGLK